MKTRKAMIKGAAVLFLLGLGLLGVLCASAAEISAFQDKTFRFTLGGELVEIPLHRDQAAYNVPTLHSEFPNEFVFWKKALLLPYALMAPGCPLPASLP